MRWHSKDKRDMLHVAGLDVCHLHCDLVPPRTAQSRPAIRVKACNAGVNASTAMSLATVIPHMRELRLLGL